MLVGMKARLRQNHVAHIDLPRSLCSQLPGHMRFSNLAPLLVLLLKEYGEVPEEEQTFFQEDCAGCASLTTAVKAFGIPADCRDAPCRACFVSSASRQILHNPLLDLLTGVGFLTTLQAVRPSALFEHTFPRRCRSGRYGLAACGGAGFRAQLGYGYRGRRPSGV